MDTTRSSSLARRARLLKRGAPLVATAAAALVFTAACTDAAPEHGAPSQKSTPGSSTSGGSGSVTVEHGPSGSSVTVDHGPDGSVSVDGGSVHVSGGAGGVSVQRNPDGSLTVTRPGSPPTTVPAGPDQGLSVTVDPSDGSSGSVSVNVGGGSSSVSVTH